MAKRIKKVNPKDVFKKEVTDVVADYLVSQGYEVEDGVEYGFTKGTMVIRGRDFDMQLKPITPKTGVSRYEKDEEGEDE